MNSDGEHDSTTCIGMHGEDDRHHMDKDEEDDSTTWIRMGRMTAPHG
jgi:hypothetical protein